MTQGMTGAPVPSSNIPVGFMPRDVSRFHRAFKSSPHDHQEILWLHYVQRGRARDKISHLGMSSKTYYRRLRAAQRAIGYRLDTGDTTG